MPSDSNNFEEAYELCRDSDSVVSHTAKCLYQQMLNRNRSEGLVPSGAFNILYFIQSVVRLLKAAYADVELNPSEFTDSCPRINAINFPASLERWKSDYIVKSGLVNRYLELVKLDSDSTGDAFDVTYAITILAMAIDKPTLDRILNKEGEGTDADDNDVDFDYWLSGFNSQQ